MEKPTEFDYLLNRMEHAAQQETPADHHYGTHRASLMRHVRALERDAERYRWLRAGPAMTVTHDVSGAVLVHDHKARFAGFAEGLDASVDAAMAAAPAVG